MRFIAAIAIASALVVDPAYAGTGNIKTVSGSAGAQVVVPLVLSHWGGRVLNFGRFSVGSTAGTVTVDEVTGAGVATGGATFTSNSTTGLDYFIANGAPNALIGIVTTGGTVTSGTKSMTFTTVPMLPAGYLPFTGSGFFTVGGTLNVAANQGVGTYTGSYNVTVAYQ